MNVDVIKKDVPPQGNEGLGFITHSCDFVLLWATKRFLPLELRLS